MSFLTFSGEIVECVTNAFVEYDAEGKYLRTVAMYSELSDQARANFKYRTCIDRRQLCCTPLTGTD